MDKQSIKPKVLMVGPGRDVMGGISTVVNSYYELELNKNVELRYIASMEDGNQLKKLWIAIKAYCQFCACLKKYDIIHIHMAAQASFNRKSIFIRKAFKSGKKIIIHCHAADFDDYFLKQVDGKKQKVIRYIFSLADKVITLSEEWADFYGKNICTPEKVVVVHNAVIIPDYIKADYSNHNILFLGRLGKRKGIYDLLEVIPEILKVVPDSMFYLGGDGDIEQCKYIAINKGFTDHVKFLGWVRGDNKEKYFKNCSIFVLPSYQEGMPMSVLEAMSYGLAVISTNAGGIPQIIESNINGLRFEAGDVKALQSDIIALLTNKTKKRQYGYKGYETINREFNIVKNINRLVELYWQLLC